MKHETIRETAATAAARGKPEAEKPAEVAVKTVNLALQGGGAHGAFAWGVLDRLLEEPRIAFEAVSAASAGAMNAMKIGPGRWRSMTSTKRGGRVARKIA